MPKAGISLCDLPRGASPSNPLARAGHVGVTFSNSYKGRVLIPDHLVSFAPSATMDGLTFHRGPEKVEGGGFQVYISEHWKHTRTTRCPHSKTLWVLRPAEDTEDSHFFSQPHRVINGEGGQDCRADPYYPILYFVDARELHVDSM